MGYESGMKIPGRSLGAMLVLLAASQAVGAPAGSPPEFWNGRIYDTSTRKWLDEASARRILGQTRILVLGEKHDTPSVQAQQARALDWATESQGFGPLDHWALGWEFLDHADQPAIETAWSQFGDGALNAEGVMDALQGKDRHRSYLPILDAGIRFGGMLKGLNLSRAQKAPILTGGLASLDPSLIPPGFEMGGSGYRERFEAAMAGHASPEQLERYFEAQCLTDDVLAYQLLLPRVRFRALVAGSFHSDYADGVVARLRARAPDQTLHVIRFVDASDYSASELEPDLALHDPIHHKRYGNVADWVWFAGEPKP